MQAGSIWADLCLLLPFTAGTILDVGCGAQPYRDLIPAHCNYVPIDHSDASEFGYQIPGTLYYSGDRWPIADAFADVVLSTETLEHVPSPLLFLREARRCVKENGTVILTVPFAARWHFVPHDYWRFTPSGLATLLQEAGFTAVSVFARGGAVTVAAYKLITLVMRLLVPQTRRPLVACLARLAGAALLPVLALLALVANTSLNSTDNDDCLGYTVIAQP